MWPKATLIDAELSSGTHEVTWDGRSVSGGVYFYRLTAGSDVQAYSMTLLK